MTPNFIWQVLMIKELTKKHSLYEHQQSKTNINNQFLSKSLKTKLFEGLESLWWTLLKSPYIHLLPCPYHRGRWDEDAISNWVLWGTPREQICKNCTPDAACLTSCARQNWFMHANHARQFSVHAEDLPENVHAFQTGGTITNTQTH